MASLETGSLMFVVRLEIQVGVKPSTSRVCRAREREKRIAFLEKDMVETVSSARMLESDIDKCQ